MLIMLVVAAFMVPVAALLVIGVIAAYAAIAPHMATRRAAKQASKRSGPPTSRN